MKKLKISIIGYGVAGKAIKDGFDADKCEFTLIDLNLGNDVHSTSLYEDVFFICLPTPMGRNGEINADIVVDVVNYLLHNRTGTVVIKSTITPEVIEELTSSQEHGHKVVYNPEFLTERSAKFDFINQARFILGGRKSDTESVAKLYKWRFGESVPCIETNFETAEMIKYMNNCFFATKVSFMNEMKLVADKVGVDWDMAVEGFVRDGRIGHTHLNVPGPDGKLGFGGSCFPKDIQAMIQFGEDLGMDLNTLQGAWETNCEIRPSRDWEKLEGRSVVDNKKVN